MDSFVEDLIAALNEGLKVKHEELPTFQFLSHLRASLLDLGFSVEEAEAISGEIDVELAPGSLEGGQLITVAYQYGQLISNMRAGLKKCGFQDPTPVLLRRAKRISLKLE